MFHVATSVDNAFKIHKDAPKENISSITSPYDWVQLKGICNTIKDLKRIIVVPAGITLFNIHRVILFSGKYRGDVGLDHSFTFHGEKYTSGLEKSVKEAYNDRKVRLLQVIASTQDAFQYAYGPLSFQFTVEAIKKAEKQKLDWLPRVCTGSRGTFPTEISLGEPQQQWATFKPKKEIHIDKINKTLMHERFGANQKTNNTSKRAGPSILCQSNTPHSTISMIYKRPIQIPSDNSDSSEYSESSLLENKENAS
eukprot:TRINITY_DN9899_c0_g1_i1.p1 TRINITY_DN9899_c0_g1~~TRINITY_DN9899_c0_g1_i1.p1  ORF type:complete len:253 (+),score=49.65 TRINITY_DN9899_c0_g1_i1:34-792(+)